MRDAIDRPALFGGFMMLVEGSAARLGDLPAPNARPST